MSVMNMNDYVFQYLKGVCPMPSCNAPISYWLPRGVTRDGKKALIQIVCKEECYSYIEIDREAFEKHNGEVLDIQWYPGWCPYGPAITV